jgi:predicted RNA-binding protein with PUA-like domain
MNAAFTEVATRLGGISAVLAVLAALLFSFLISRTMRPVRTVATTLNRLKDRDYDVEIHPVTTRDEVGALTSACIKLRDDLREGDEVFIYHSSCAIPAVVGMARVASAPRPDPTQFDRSAPGFDPKSDPGAPRWYLVDIRYERHLPRPVTLAELKAQREELAGLALLERPRLSVMPVTAVHRDKIMELAGA